MLLVTAWKGEHWIPNFLLARRLYNPHRRPIDSVLSCDSQEMLRKLKRVVIIIIIQWVKKVALILENSWTNFWWAKLFWPSSFLLTLSVFFLWGGTGLISLSDWSWRLLLHGDVWLLNSISRNDRSGKITGFFCIVCSFCAFLVKKSWMQLNTDHKKACLLKDFFLDIFQNVGFVCFRMCWRILMTLLLQLAVVEGHQELPLVTIWQDQNSSKL